MGALRAVEAAAGDADAAARAALSSRCRRLVSRLERLALLPPGLAGPSAGGRLSRPEPRWLSAMRAAIDGSPAVSDDGPPLGRQSAAATALASAVAALASRLAAGLDAVAPAAAGGRTAAEEAQPHGTPRRTTDEEAQQSGTAGRTAAAPDAALLTAPSPAASPLRLPAQPPASPPLRAAAAHAGADLAPQPVAPAREHVSAAEAAAAAPPGLGPPGEPAPTGPARFTGGALEGRSNRRRDTDTEPGAGGWGGGSGEEKEGEEEEAAASPTSFVFPADDVEGGPVPAQEGPRGGEAFGVSLGRMVGEWEECEDPTTGARYYFHAALGTSAWVIPLQDDDGSGEEDGRSG